MVSAWPVLLMTSLLMTKIQKDIHITTGIELVSRSERVRYSKFPPDFILRCACLAYASRNVRGIGHRECDGE